MPDLNVEYNLYRECCNSAAKALERGDFAESCNLFSQALQKAQLYSPRSLDEAYCLHGLIDSFIGQNRAAEAKAACLQLEQLLSELGERSSERRLDILLKLARCHEKLREFDQACNVYSEALALAEAKVAYGLPKMTTILESYANVLRFARKDPEKLAEIEQKTWLSRSNRTNPQLLSALVGSATEKSDKTRKNAEAETFAKPRFAEAATNSDNDATAESGKLSQLLREHPRIALGGLTAVIFCLLQVLALISAVEEIKGRTAPPSDSPAAVGRIYTTPEGRESIRFLERGKAEIKGVAGMTNARCYVAAPGWSEVIATFIMYKPNQLWLAPNAQGLRVLGGTKQLYDLKACPITELSDRMNIIAKYCVQHILRYHNYPDTAALLGALPECTEKMQDGKEHLPLVVEGNKEKMATDIHAFIKDRSQELVHENNKPLEIVCMTMPGSETMIIYATDSDGAPIKGQLDCQLAIVVSNGELLSSAGLTTKSDVFNPLPKVVVVALSKPEVIRQLYGTFMILFPIFAALAVAAFVLKNLKVSSGRDQVPLPIRVRVIGWLLWAIVGIIASYYFEETCMSYFFRS
jgi:hypothetical protein